MQRALFESFLEHAQDFIYRNCDELYKALFAWHFRNGRREAVLKALERYQNEDGGFGHGLEPDFLAPASSPMATSIAFQIFADIGQTDHPMIQKAVNYLENSYDHSARRWWTVGPEVNDYAHAPWWTFDSESGGTAIDTSWGNPTAELTGWLILHRNMLTKLEPQELLNLALDQLKGKTNFESEHELYCYLRLYKQLAEQDRQSVKPLLERWMTSVVETDPEKWKDYVPQPVHMIDGPDDGFYPAVKHHIDENLRFLIDTSDQGLWYPNWAWGAFEEEWKQSRKNWTASLSIGSLVKLRRFFGLR